VEPEDEVAVGLNGGQADATIARMLLGRQLRRFREAADVTPEQAGHEIRASRSKISRMENGRVGFKTRDVADLLTLYGIVSEQTRAQALELALRVSTRSGGRLTAASSPTGSSPPWDWRRPPRSSAPSSSS
jgi:transcriptional regulator with XRE-family HTH domain